MKADVVDIGAQSDATWHDPSGRMRRFWIILASVLVGAIFLQAVFAGSMLGGAEWARRAHLVTAMVLSVATIAAGLAAIIALRRIKHGLRFGLTLLALGAVIVLQTALGKLLAQGADLMAVHVPLGVALVGLAGYVAALSRRIGIG